MPNTSQNPGNGVATFFKELFEEQEVAARARLVATFASGLTPDCAASVYTIAAEAVSCGAAYLSAKICLDGCERVGIAVSRAKDAARKEDVSSQSRVRRAWQWD